MNNPGSLVDRTEAVICNNGELDLRSKQYAPLREMFGPLSHLSWYDDEDCLLGAVTIFGVLHHVTCVRVNDVGEPTNDPHQRLEDILAGCYDGQPQTVELPGLEGEWVIGVDPHR
jgi:hypothetical protein